MRKRTTRIDQRVLSKMAAGPARAIAPSSSIDSTAKVPAGTFLRTRTTVVAPPSRKRAMAAQRALQKAQAETSRDKQKKVNKTRQAMQGAVMNGKRLVPLSPAL